MRISGVVASKIGSRLPPPPDSFFGAKGLPQPVYSERAIKLVINRAVKRIKAAPLLVVYYAIIAANQDNIDCRYNRLRLQKTRC